MKAGFFAMLALVPVHAWGAGALTYDQQEAFLKTAKITAAKGSKKGVTGTVRVTMTDGKITHDASVQRIDEYQAVFQAADGKTELNFKDTYKFNIAGWKLAKMLGIEDMVPPSVERAYEGTTGAFTWWIDDVLMDEETRQGKKTEPPDRDHWDKEIHVMHVYDQLMFNTDSNATNLLIDTQWRVWMIDHTRAFRTMKTLQDPKMLANCDRGLLEKMKALDKVSLQKEMKNYLTGPEIQGLLARRDVIVKFFESKGPGVLYDRPSRN
jgi:hypothetical protein